jgi:meso-butanediol dehydrogenase / (S,S)-butanediol dehydrogenase / diacetyl reductase
MNLTGKMALITGGGTGIGAAVARRFAADGAKVCITGRRAEKLEETAKTIREGAVVTCPGDVAKYKEVKRMVETSVAFGGRLDIVVNNAATDAHGSILDLDIAEWNKVLSVNLTGPFMLMKESIPHLIKGGGGSIINISSLAGIRCMPGSVVYATTKAGLIHMTRQAALEYGKNKIRCNVICPGAVRTDMIEQLVRPVAEKMGTDLEGGLKIFSSNVPLKRPGSPEELASLCTYLASDESAYMTGAVLVMDGGAAIVDVSGATLSNLGIS